MLAAGPDSSGFVARTGGVSAQLGLPARVRVLLSEEATNTDLRSESRSSIAATVFCEWRSSGSGFQQASHASPPFPRFPSMVTPVIRCARQFGEPVLYCHPSQPFADAPNSVNGCCRLKASPAQQLGQHVFHGSGIRHSGARSGSTSACILGTLTGPRSTASLADCAARPITEVSSTIGCFGFIRSPGNDRRGNVPCSGYGKYHFRPKNGNLPPLACYFLSSA